MSRVVLHRGAQAYQSSGSAIDISIPLRFDGPQPGFFSTEAATARPMHAGDFIGDTRLGGSCNADHVDFIPHCHGTHTECVGHITTERVAVNRLADEPLYLAGLVTVDPVSAGTRREQTRLSSRKSDRLITRQQLEDAATAAGIGEPDALIVRTLPNERDKMQRDWQAADTPYFSVEAMQWIVARGVRHLLVDLPSVDRLDDANLVAHRIFWGLAAGSRSVHDATRETTTITELIFVPDEATDGLFLLAIELAPFASDAAPSRPLLYRIDA